MGVGSWCWGWVADKWGRRVVFAATVLTFSLFTGIAGLAPTLVGVWQINFQVPTTVTAGNDVPIVVIMNSIPSDNPSVQGQISTTIALK